MSLGYGQLAFSQIRGELTIQGYSGVYSARSMASNAGFGTPDRVSDFHGFTATPPEYINSFTQGYSVYNSGYDYVCADYQPAVGITNQGRYVNGGNVNSGLYGYYSLDAFNGQVVGFSNGYAFDFTYQYCAYFL